jgi:hypothetical protein
MLIHNDRQISLQPEPLLYLVNNNKSNKKKEKECFVFLFQPSLLQLCLAISAIAIHMAGPQWPNMVEDLVGFLSSQPQTHHCLLALLQVLPEEAEIHRGAVSPAQRNAYAAALQKVPLLLFCLFLHTHAHTLSPTAFLSLNSLLYLFFFFCA